ncbi:MAG: GOLPH3/VPS74 family protein [Stackebrandtia sp.]
MLPLVEQLLLLSYDDESGRNKTQHLELGLGGAVLLDLALAGRVDVSAGRVVVVDAKPVGHPILDAALNRISGDKPRKARPWVQKLSRGIRGDVVDGLVARRVLDHQRQMALGVFPYHRHRPLDPTHKADARARLDTAVQRGAAPDAVTGALAGLIYALRMERRVLPERGRREVRKVLKTISEGSWASDATRAAVDAAQAAVNAAIVSAIAASSAAASSSGGG